MTSPGYSRTEVLRTEMRVLLSRKLLWAAIALSVAWPVLNVVAGLGNGNSGGAVDSEEIIEWCSFVALWLMVPSFLVGACAAGGGRRPADAGGVRDRVPKPTSLLVARLVSTLSVVTVLALVGVALLMVVMAFGLTGADPGVGDPGLLDEWARMVVLTLVLVWVTAVLGLSFAVITRRAATAVAVLVAYVAAWELPMGAAGNSDTVVERSLFSNQALSWLAQPTSFAGSSMAGPFTRVEAGATLLALAFAALAATLLVEHRRSRAAFSGGAVTAP